MNSKRTNQLIEFLKVIEKTKQIERQIYISGRQRLETDAEHAWHVAMFVVLFEKEFPKLDVAKMLKMALIHDLVEIYAGDTFAFDKNHKKSQKEREDKAAKRLFKKLPKDLEKEFWSFYQEYENSTTQESKIAKSFDKLQPILQNILSQGKSWKKHQVTYNDIDDYKHQFMTHDRVIIEIYNKLLKEIRKKKLV